MGTRSLTIFEGDGMEYAVMYRQYDGSPEWHGEQLAAFLQNMPLVNGYSPGEQQAANGMGCLAAQVVAHFKQGIGNVYLYPSGTREAWEDYRYHVIAPDVPFGERVAAIMRVVAAGYDGAPDTTLFEGTAEQFLTQFLPQPQASNANPSR